jgi:dolichol-phosphate mannosyltransferase
MIDSLEADQFDIVVASRFMQEGDASGLNGLHRRLLSRGGNLMARALLKVAITDPMSGFFMTRRQIFDENASRLSGRGFKVLLDLLASVQQPLRIMELPMHFRPRNSGASKLDLSVELAFLAMLIEKTLGRIVSLRFLAFCFVGGTGVVVHLAVLKLALTASWPFAFAQAVAAIVAMTSNFWLNNVTTYRDQRLVGWRILSGLLSFYAVCSIGFVTNVGVGQALFAQHYSWWLSGVLGAAVGAVWNYSVSSAVTWRRR